MSTATRSTMVWKVEHDFQHDELIKFQFLYEDWIYPNRYADAQDKDVLDCGSGPGIQAKLFAPYAKTVTAVDLEAVETTREKVVAWANKVECVSADIAEMDLKRSFDIVNCVGVIHHTDDPTKTFRNLVRHTKPGGRVIVWAYAREGNFLMRTIVEPLRQLLLNQASHGTLWFLSCLLNALLWPVVQTIYRLPLRWLPYYEYFENYRKMSFKRNSLNIYDKLNAPQQHFISRKTIEEWFNSDEFEDIHISPYKGVSWRASGTKKA